MVIVVRKRSLILLILLILPISVSAATNPYSNYIGACTWDAWDRAYNYGGVALPYWHDACKWEIDAKNSGYTTGTIAKSNSIEVQQRGGCPGHVEYLYKIYTFDEWYSTLTEEELDNIYDYFDRSITKSELYSYLRNNMDEKYDLCIYQYDNPSIRGRMPCRYEEGYNPGYGCSLDSNRCNFDYDDFYYYDSDENKLVKYDNSGNYRYSYIYLDIPRKTTTKKTTKKTTTKKTTKKTTTKKVTTKPTTILTTKKNEVSVKTTVSSTTTTTSIISIDIPTNIIDITQETTENTTEPSPTTTSTTTTTTTQISNDVLPESDNNIKDKQNLILVVKILIVADVLGIILIIIKHIKGRNG